MSDVKSPEEMTIGELRLAIWEVDRQKSWLDRRLRQALKTGR